VMKSWDVRGKAPGEDLRSLYARLNRSLEQIEGAITYVLVPPPIQGIGNASGFTMQVELRDGAFDYPLLESLARTIVANGGGTLGSEFLGFAFGKRFRQTGLVDGALDELRLFKKELTSIEIEYLQNQTLPQAPSAELKRERHALDIELHAHADAGAVVAACRGQHRQALVVLHGVDPGIARQGDLVAAGGDPFQRDDTAVAVIAAALGRHGVDHLRDRLQQHGEGAVLGQRRLAFDVGEEAFPEELDLAIDTPVEPAAAILGRNAGCRGQERQDTGYEPSPHPDMMIKPSSAGQS